MRIVDAVTFWSVVATTYSQRVLLMRKVSTKDFVTFHIGCIPAGKKEMLSTGIVNHANEFELYLMEEIGPQCDCRYCEGGALT